MTETVPDLLSAFELYRRRWAAIPETDRRMILAEQAELRRTAR